MPSKVVLLIKIVLWKAVFVQPFEIWGKPTSVELVFINLTEDGNFPEAIGQEFTVPAQLLAQESRTEIEGLMSGKIKTDIKNGTEGGQILEVTRKLREDRETLFVAFEVDPRALSL